jgi:hypothetical protein
VVGLDMRLTPPLTVLIGGSWRVTTLSLKLSHLRIEIRQEAEFALLGSLILILIHRVDLPFSGWLLRYEGLEEPLGLASINGS